MPLELLHQLSKKSLPLTVTDMEEIDKLRVLRAAGHVAALLPSINAKKPFARVLAISEEGRKSLRNPDAVTG